MGVDFFYTEPGGSEDDNENRGFSLNYRQLPCWGKNTEHYKGNKQAIEQLKKEQVGF